MSHYVEVIDVRPEAGSGSKTGRGAAGATESETREIFEAARRYEVPDDRMEFLVDLHIGGDLVDTICIDKAGLEQLTGRKAPTPKQSMKWDQRYWSKALRPPQKRGDR